MHDRQPRCLRPPPAGHRGGLLCGCADAKLHQAMSGDGSAVLPATMGTSKPSLVQLARAHTQRRSVTSTTTRDSTRLVTALPCLRARSCEQRKGARLSQAKASLVLKRRKTKLVPIWRMRKSRTRHRQPGHPLRRCEGKSGRAHSQLSVASTMTRDISRRLPHCCARRLDHAEQGRTRSEKQASTQA